MFKKFKIVMLIFILTFISSGISGNFVNAEEIESDNVYFGYEEAVEKGIISAEDYTKLEWNEFQDKQKASSEVFLSDNDQLVLSSTSSKAILPKRGLRAGDFIVTNNGGYGITGHAAIMLDSKTVLHISGPGAYPKTLSFSTFRKSYLKKSSHWIQVFGSPSKEKGLKAAAWAKKTYANKKNIKYGMSPKLSTINPTYCSKIVYQAYYTGVGKTSVYKPNSNLPVEPLKLASYIKGSGIIQYHKK